jgi:hypothetical protein
VASWESDAMWQWLSGSGSGSGSQTHYIYYYYYYLIIIIKAISIKMPFLCVSDTKNAKFFNFFIEIGRKLPIKHIKMKKRKKNQALASGNFTGGGSGSGT